MDGEKVEINIYHGDMSGIKVELKNESLWNQFHKEETEMIITKSGRRMFPSLRLSLKGLEPDARYFILLELELASQNRFKFSCADWVSGGGAEPQPHATARLYVHPDSPATGSTWMLQDISFHRAKLTNNTLDRAGNLVLTSMHKYQPKIHIIRTSDILALRWSPTLTLTYPQTQFIAVTAYQNEKITKLKIDNNPFAKGFRENGQARIKRRNEQNMEEKIKLEDDKKICLPQKSETCTASTSPISGQDDSGVSVGSVTPPLSPTSINSYGIYAPAPPCYPLLSGIPPPAFYPHTLWPSYQFHYPMPYPTTFFPPYYEYMVPTLPTDYSIKH